ncbi:HAD family hydrolase [bacterium]|nr:MAG: HAD family hydrolase [bacterium]
MLRALIFDFDGLILDTETPEVHAWQEMYAAYGQELDFAWVAYQIGRGAEQIVERPVDKLANLVPSLDKEAVEGDYRARRMSAILAEPIRPGVERLLAEAKAAGIRLCVASSSRHEWVDTHLSRLGLFDFFEFTCCADDVERAKPFPDLYLLALEKLGLDASEAMALEDSPNGSQAALDAGLMVVAVPNEVTRYLDLSHATAQFASMEEVTVEGLRELRG